MTPEQLRQNKSVKIIDIRKKPDDRQIPGSLRYSGEQLETSDILPFSKEEHVVLYCGSGNSCSRIASELHQKGYNTEALEGGYAGWKESGLPTEEIGPLLSSERCHAEPVEAPRVRR